MTQEERDITAEVIIRLKQRKREVWVKPSPYIIPLWEKTEIEQKISQLQKLLGEQKLGNRQTELSN